ncbi:MAG TPA: ROK family protein [Methylomirabilota bacterium]|nr:ROK family protein [Methylomirabilota bacterium]
MPRSPLLLGVDVGGTTVAAGAVTAEGEVVVEESVPTHRHGPGRALDTLAELIATVRERAEGLGHAIGGIGLGIPGPVDVAAGRVGEPVHHIPELAGRSLGAELAERFALPVFLDNDVNALALAEWRFGHGRGARSLVALAVGTGIGAGIILDGRLVRGAAGFGGELGHVPVDFDGPPCWCGGRGCLVVFASGRGIAEAARARATGSAGTALLRAAGGDAGAITAPLVFASAAEGDTVAAAVVDEACRALAAMIGTVVNGLNPEVVVITGGVATSLAPLEARIMKAAGEYAFAQALAATRVVIVPGDKRVTMRGAAALVLYETEDKDPR